MVSKDLILLLHPIAAVIFVFPLLGIVINQALLVCQCRLEDKSKIPTVHMVLHSVVLLLFIGQGITVTQVLLEVPLH
jgi:hypothetical protein